MAYAVPANVEVVLREFQNYSLRRTNGTHRGQGKQLIQDLAGAIGKEFRLDPSEPAPGATRALNCFRVTCRVLPRRLSSRAGELAPRPGGFVLTVFEDSAPQLVLDVARTPVTRRGWFTLGHELAHVAFYQMDSENATPVRLVPRPMLSASERHREEGLCEDFARALLLPNGLSASVPQEGSLDALIALWRGRHWQVPLIAVVRRVLYDWNKWPGNVLAVVGRNQKPDFFWGRQIERRASSLRPRLSDALIALVGEPTLSNGDRVERLSRAGVPACDEDAGVLVMLGNGEIELLLAAAKRQSGLKEHWGLFDSSGHK